MNRSGAFYHETLYRSGALMGKLNALPVTICGAGALGANLCESLARQGFAHLRVIDRDRVEERNLSTQPYYRTDIGAFKAKMMANALYRALGVTVDARCDTLTSENAGKLLSGSGVVLDTFDNSGSRQAVKETCERNGLTCLHVGLASDYAEILWNEVYRVPSAALDDMCDYPLARNLAMLAVAVACETLISFVATGEMRNSTLTLSDFAIRPFE
ncbi:MAG TPA: ThiF family adenylyltransferase [Chthonomonadaceae bacterium]|nr:ThiF family adenylyltransferase [Chthonomonadaceae bacterium]